MFNLLNPIGGGASITLTTYYFAAGEGKAETVSTFHRI